MSAPKSEKITPDLSLFAKLGARSRAFPMVITELVDNSLDSWVSLPGAKTRGKRLTIEITASEAKDAWFVIKDNAGGMTQKELVAAMTVAKSSKTGDSRFIGTFGFGLKSAAMYIGGVFKIFSVSHTSPKVVNFVEFDREKFAKQKEWVLDFHQMSVDDAAKIGVHFKDGHGTVFHIRNDRYRSANKKGILRRLQRTFAPRLDKNPKLKIKLDEFKQDMRILFNDEAVVAAGPFYEPWNNSATAVQERADDFYAALRKSPNDPERFEQARKTDFIKGKDPQQNAAVIPSRVKWYEPILGVTEIPLVSIADPRKEKQPRKVWGRIGILDRGMAHNNEYGFDLIKNGRVIEEFVLDKDLKNREIGLVASNHNARIVGELYLDEWDTDHQKLSFLKDSEQWEKLTEFVAKQVKPFLAVSSNLQHPGELLKSKLELKNDDNTPELIADKRFADNIPTIKKDVQKAIRSSSVKDALVSLERARESEPRPKKPSPKETASTTKLLFTTPEISFTRKKESGPLVLTKVRKERSNDILEITLNRDHPFLAHRESAELNAIGELLAIDYYASYVLSNKDALTHEDFIKLRDSLLRELSPRKPKLS